MSGHEWEPEYGAGPQGSRWHALERCRRCGAARAWMKSGSTDGGVVLKFDTSDVRTCDEEAVMSVLRS